MSFILLSVDIHSSFYLVDYNIPISNTPSYHSSRPARPSSQFHCQARAGLDGPEAVESCADPPVPFPFSISILYLRSTGYISEVVHVFLL